MKNFRINSDKQIPSDQFIGQNKPSFSSVSSSFSGFRNPFRNAWQWGLGTTVVVVSTVAAIYFTSGLPESQSNANTDVRDSITTCVNAPIAEVDIKPQVFTFTNSEGGAFQTELGTRITIPENAFVDKSGNTVKGPVNLEFREFHNVPDFFRAGIPMTYDSAGEEYTFESAGMFELLAYAGGEELQIADGKEITVDLVTDNTNPKFNTYYLDTVADKWNYIAENTFVENENTSGTSLGNDFTYAFSNNNTPENSDIEPFYVKPVKAVEANYIFKVNYKTEDFPELSIYKNVLFEVDESRQKFNPEWYKVNWATVSVKKSKLEGLYLLKLSRPDTTVKLYAKPVFADADYNQAIASYKKSTSDEQTARANYQSRSSEMVETKRADMGYTPNVYTGFRRVSVVRTGIYNCDYPLRINNDCLAASFSENGQKMVPSKIYWTDKDVNAMYQAEGNSAELCFVKGATIVMWVVDAQGRIAVVSADQFAKVTRKNDSPVFDLVFQESREGLETLHEALYGPNNSAKNLEFNTQTMISGALPSVSCYPNPATDLVNVDITGNTQFVNSQLMLINGKGQLIQVLSTNSVNESVALNISSLASGVYFVQLTLSDGRSVSKRIVKQ